MGYFPDICEEDMKDELVSKKGKASHAAFRLFIHYCKRRNRNTGVCFPSLEQIAADTGIPKSNVSQLNDFLEEKFWIIREGKGKKYIRPLKGFYDLEFAVENGAKVLVSRTDFEGEKVLINRTEILINRTENSNKLNAPLKEVLNQHNEPTKLTKGATSVAAPGAKKSKSSAKKSAPRSPIAKSANAAPTGKPTDNRIKHPAIQMVKQITGRFPSKDQWDKIIREINAKDILFFKNSFEIWRSFNGSPQSFDDWLFVPNQTKMPPQRFPWKNGNGNGNKKPIDVVKNDDAAFDDYSIELDERDLLLPGMREVVLESLKVMQKSGSVWISELENTYHPDDWAWLMKNLEKVEQEG